MSLDVYLCTGVEVLNPREISIRENGETKAITREEWDARFPDREPYTVASWEEAFSANITHNLGKMAAEAGIYLALWRPGEMLDPSAHSKITGQSAIGNYHGEGGVFELENLLPVPHARDLIEPLRAGLALLRAEPERFKCFNPENGWGDYDGLVRFVERYLAACEASPDAEVRISR